MKDYFQTIYPLKYPLQLFRSGSIFVQNVNRPESGEHVSMRLSVNLLSPVHEILKLMSCVQDKLCRIYVLTCMKSDVSHRLVIGAPKHGVYVAVETFV